MNLFQKNRSYQLRGVSHFQRSL